MCAHGGAQRWDSDVNGYVDSVEDADRLNGRSVFLCTRNSVMPTCEHVAYDTRLAPAASAYGKSISLIDWATSTPPSVRLTSLRPGTTVCNSEPEVVQGHIQTMPEMVLKLEPHYVHALGAGVVLCGSGVKGFQSLGCAWSAVVRMIQVRCRE